MAGQDILMLVFCLLIWQVLMQYDGRILMEDELDKIAEVRAKNPELAYIDNPQNLKYGCKVNLPTMSVGDYFVNSTEISLNQYKQEHEVFILAMTDTTCDSCCRGEVLLDEIYQMFKAGDISYKGKPIPIVRVDISINKDLAVAEELSVKNVPKLVLYNSDGKYYTYDQNFNLEFFLHFVNRHLYPVVLLKTRQQIDDFLDTNKEWMENTPFYSKKYYEMRDIFSKLNKVTRVIAFSTDKFEISELKSTALRLAIRDDLRIGKVTKKDLVEYYKNKLGKHFLCNQNLF